MPDLTEPNYSQSSAPTLLQSVLRRWPLLVIGAVAGLVAGFLGYAALPPTYQSTAQLQVIKRDNSRTADIRPGYIDDYVANQLELLRSETIHMAAAKTQKMQEASPEFLKKLNEDDLSPHKVLKQGLTVSRSKETGAGVMAGNSIVNLAFASDNPRDTQIVLEALIETYKAELKSISGRNMAEKINSMEQLRDGIVALRDKAVERKFLKEGERRRIATEKPDAIGGLLVQLNNDRLKLDYELAGINSSLKAIERAAGKNQTARFEVYMQLTGNKLNVVDPVTNELQRQLLLLELKQKQLAEQYGVDHPQMKEVAGQIELVKGDLKRYNPDESGKFDALEALRLSLLQKKETAEDHVKLTQARMDAERQTQNALIPVLTDISKAEDEITQLEKRILLVDNDLAEAKATQRATQDVVYEARENNKPRLGLKVGPVLLLWLLPGLFLGGLVGAGLAMLVELRDKSFRTPAEIRSRLGVPVLGHLPNIRLDLAREGDVSAAYDPSLVTAVRPKSVEAEAYRGVRAQVLTAAEKFGHAVVQVTSPTPGDGKSTLAANLAISLAQSGKRVVLLDCDFRKPRVHKLFDLPKPEVGLASVTSGDNQLTEAIRHSDVDRLDLLPCGPRPSNPAELLSGPRFQAVLNELKSMYDFVIVDTPPLLAVSDPRVVAQRVDGVVLVFRITNKVRPLAERAREYLSDMGANLLGVVVNGGGGGKGDEYGYGYGYSYAYAYDYDYEYAETYSTEDKSKF